MVLALDGVWDGRLLGVSGNGTGLAGNRMLHSSRQLLYMIDTYLCDLKVKNAAGRYETPGESETKLFTITAIYSYPTCFPT